MSSTPNRHEMELIAAAAGAERSNRPRWLIVLAAAVFAAAVVYLAMGMGALTRAGGGLSQAEERLGVVQRRADLYRQEAGALADRAVPEDNGTALKIEALGDLVGLDVRVTEPDRYGGYNDRGVRRRALNVDLSNVDPALFLSWLHAVMQSEDLRGLQIRTLSMEPQPARPGAPIGWRINIAFDRLERRV